jgi:hypothetical protein
MSIGTPAHKYAQGCDRGWIELHKAQAALSQKNRHTLPDEHRPTAHHRIGKSGSYRLRTRPDLAGTPRRVVTPWSVKAVD